MATSAETSQTDRAEDDRSGRERREGERLIAYWQGKLEELGGGLTLAGLDLSRMASQDWSNRFVIAIDPMVDRSSFMLYGDKIASLLDLPAQVQPSLPLVRQISPRYIGLFIDGCVKAQMAMAPVRLENEAPMSNHRVEQYRAVFIPIGSNPNTLMPFAFGALNSRIVER
jgi:hypothetical protein